jgi:hypothetical protein
VLAQIKTDGTPRPNEEDLDFGGFVDVIGLSEIDELDRRFAN